MFKLETVLTFVEYLSRGRIEQAQLLLHNKNLRVSEIAYDVGFQTLTHFNRIFRKLYNLCLIDGGDCATITSRSSRRRVAPDRSPCFARSSDGPLNAPPI